MQLPRRRIPTWFSYKPKRLLNLLDVLFARIVSYKIIIVKTQMEISQVVLILWSNNDAETGLDRQTDANLVQDGVQVLMNGGIPAGISWGPAFGMEVLDHAPLNYFWPHLLFINNPSSIEDRRKFVSPETCAKPRV